MRITAHGLPLLFLVMRPVYSATSPFLAWKRGRNLDNMPFNFVPFFRFYTVSGLLVIGVLEGASVLQSFGMARRV